MRIRIVGPVYPFKGGIALHTAHLAWHLLQAGHDVAVESWRRQYPGFLYPGQQELAEPETASDLPIRRRLSWMRPDGWWQLGSRLATEADLVVVVLVTPVQIPAYLVALAALRRRARGQSRPRIAVLCHNVLPHERRAVDVPLVRALFRHADGVLVHSRAQGELASALGARRVEVRRLAPHLPVEAPPRGQANVDRAPTLRLLFFGLVRPYKGLDVLLRALAQGPPDVTLTVAGEFWGGAEASRKLVDELGLGERVDLRPGYVPATELPALLASADAMVAPYRTATATQNVALAFAFGLPVVATTAGALADDVEDGVNGLLCPPGDVGALAAALRRLYEPGVLARLRSGVKRVDEAAAWQSYEEGLLDTARP